LGHYFANDLFDEFGSWLVGYTASGGPDLGLLAAVGATVGEGDAGAFLDAWTAAGDRLLAEAERARTRDDRCRLTLWASACYASSYHPLYGAPVDPRLVAAFRKQIAAFDAGLALLPRPVSPLRIPFEGTTLPGYLLPAVGHEEETRPLVIFTNGYDATVTEMYFACAVLAARRGFHVLFFDGPGQGEMLIEHGMPIRPDWESVIGPVVDFALTLPNVDPGRIALSGWSLGGYLALRGASGEPRIAACIADPGLRAVFTRPQLDRLGLGAIMDAAPGSTEEKAVTTALDANAHMHWAVLQRGLWVHGAKSLGAYAEAAMAMTLEGRTGMIRCPTLLTTAENDPLSHGAEALAAEIGATATLMRFTAADGTGGHCEMGNRSLAMLRMLDWLAATLRLDG
jgi:alpha-beta hydrolase superfamily lysophospholipase